MLENIKIRKRGLTGRELMCGVDTTYLRDFDPEEKFYSFLGVEPETKKAAFFLMRAKDYMADPIGSQKFVEQHLKVEIAEKIKMAERIKNARKHHKSSV